jgi:hypothetical protein
MRRPRGEDPLGDLSGRDSDLHSVLGRRLQIIHSVTISSQMHPIRAIRLYIGHDREVIGIGQVRVPADARFERADQDAMDRLATLGVGAPPLFTGPIFTRVCMQCSPPRSIGAPGCTHD